MKNLGRNEKEIQEKLAGNPNKTQRSPPTASFNHWLVSDEVDEKLVEVESFPSRLLHEPVISLVAHLSGDFGRWRKM